MLFKKARSQRGGRGGHGPPTKSFGPPTKLGPPAPNFFIFIYFYITAFSCIVEWKLDVYAV